MTAAIAVCFNTLRPRHNFRHFADGIFKCILLNEHVWISLKISLKVVPNNIIAVVKIMAWRRPGDKPLSEPMMVSLLTHICVTLPQRVNTWGTGRLLTISDFFKRIGHHCTGCWLSTVSSLQWRHNGRDSVSNHQPYDYLLNRLFRHRSKKTSKLRVTGLCAGNSPRIGEFPAQMASYAENVSIWWRHNVLGHLRVQRLVISVPVYIRRDRRLR